MRITNKEDCRNHIRLCRLIETTFLPVTDYPDDVREWLDEAKRDIRAYLHAPSPGDRRVVKDYGIDGCVMRIELPEDIQTGEEAQEWFAECEYIRYSPRPYDCTGQAFTAWYKFFRVNGRYICYHSVAVDI